MEVMNKELKNDKTKVYMAHVDVRKHNLEEELTKSGKCF